MLDVMKLLPAVFRVWLAAILLAMPLVSCSSSTPPTAGGGGGDDPPYIVSGVAKCYSCHADGSADMGEIFSKWLDGPHGNNETVTPAHTQIDNHPDNSGFPYFVGDSGLGTDIACTPGIDCPAEPDCTRVCHDQRGDGKLLEDFSIATGIKYLGIVNRPIVGCASCHGEGANHAGSVGLVAPQYPRPDSNQCGQCHFSDFDHNEYHPEGDNIYEDYITSRHAVSIGDPHYVVYATPPDVKALCSKCHTDEGARLYKDISGGHDALEADPGFTVDVEDATVVQCRTCHNPHNPQELLFAASGGQSAEYRTCSNCHQNNGSFGLADSFHGENSGFSWGDPPPDELLVNGDKFHADEIMYDTHFDDPSTVDIIEGYNLGPITNGFYGLASARVCRDCHNVHAAGSTIAAITDQTINNINKQWSRSGHAGHIAEAKEIAEETYTYPADAPAEILAAGVQDTLTHTSPWAHYDWDDTLGVGPEKKECQRCHTATGVKNYLDALATLNDANPANNVTYDPLKNDFSHLEGWTWNTPAAKDDGNATTSGQNELLYCWGCHADNAGTLRDPGPVTAEYAIAPFPDLSGSNICIACHAGSASGETIKDSPDDADQFDNMDFVNSHYLAAGGILFTAVGYEFDTRDYSNPNPFQHNSPTLFGDNGPCVGCHMERDASHLLLAAEKDLSGVVTELTTFAQSCNPCHHPLIGQTVAEAHDAYLVTVNELRVGFEAALEALKTELDNDGFYFAPSYPYFFNAGLPVFPNRVTDWDPLDNGSGKDNMGAAFNYNLLYHEPGAYVHNLQYTKKLIYDSIDFLDGGGFDSSVEATLGGSGDAYVFLAGTRP